LILNFLSDICRYIKGESYRLITIYSSVTNIRWQYVVQFVFVEQLGLDITMAEDPQSALISYGSHGGRIFIPSIGLLDVGSSIAEEEVKTLLSVCEQWVNNPSVNLPDIFSAIFWYLSRIEEYNAPNMDIHGRFRCAQSISSTLGLVQLPLVDMLIDRLARIFSDQYTLSIKRPPCKHRSTLDIDQIWAFAHKKEKVFLGMLKSLWQRDWKTLSFRKRSFVSAYDDPFFTFIDIEKWHDELKLVPEYFVLSSDNQHLHDKNHPIEDAPARILIRSLDRGQNMGLHPSYASNIDGTLVKTEKERLEKVLEKPISKSRQHFLKLHMPHTYRTLMKNGIAEDYSMGYADAIGYRAGTGHSFLWYDLDNEMITNLRVFPLICMDVTLKEYMKLTPESALSQVLEMISLSETLQSPFTLLWHNSSMSDIGDWTPWVYVYKKILEHLAQKM
jgi:hypothetical protein